MSIDPYHAVQREIQALLQSASQLQSSYTRIRSMAMEGSEELTWARNEVRTRFMAVLLRINPLHILAQGNASFSRSRLGRSRRERQVCACFPHIRVLLISHPRIVESTDARLFGLDDAEVQKRRQYVGYVRTEIRVGSTYSLSFVKRTIPLFHIFQLEHPRSRLFYPHLSFFTHKQQQR